MFTEILLLLVFNVLFCEKQNLNLVLAIMQFKNNVLAGYKTIYKVDFFSNQEFRNQIDEGCILSFFYLSFFKGQENY